MLELEKYISTYVQDQMPSFYKEEGEDFIAFIQAYFEYLEDNNNMLYKSRRLMEYRDIDLTLNDFVQNFVEKYLTGIPDTTVLQPTDEEDRKRFLIKHIFDLYRSKGTLRGYNLLFRLLFDEQIEMEIPGDYILRPSDAKFTQPAFLELSDVSNIVQIIGRRIDGAQSGASAIVEGLRRVYINNRRINIVDLSDVNKTFITGELIFDRDRQFFTDATTAPSVVGSVTTLDVITGGTNYQVGDILTFNSSDKGVGGEAVVSSVGSLVGAAIVSVVDGGSGYKAEQTVTDSESNPQTFLSSNVKIETVGPIKSVVINDGGTGYEADEIITYSDVNILGSGGSGFTGFVNSVDGNGTILSISISTTGSTYCSNGNFTITTNNGVGANLSANIPGSGLSFSVGSVTDTENFVLNTDIIGSNNEFGVPYLTVTIDEANGYGFPADPIADSNTLIGDALTTATITMGSISTLADVNVGSGYEEAPIIVVEDQDISPYDLPDGEGGFKGRNANVAGVASVANNTVLTAAILTSGTGYRDGDLIELTNPDNASIVTGTVNLGRQGKTTGSWTETQGLLINSNRIQDSRFYQEYSYNVKSKRALDKYRDIAKNVIHVAGVALFGTLESTDLYDSSLSVTTAELEQVDA